MIYFAQAGDGGPVKIGLTTGDPWKRAAALQTGCPLPITVLGVTDGGEDEERRLHETYGDLRKQGEWFAPDESLLNEIKRISRPIEDSRRRRCEVPKDVRDLATVAQIVKVLGGGASLSRKLGLSPPQVSNWVTFNKIPARMYVVMKRELERLGKTAPDALWGMVEGDLT